MPTGVSSPYYPNQPEPPSELVLDDSYVLFRLHDAQAFFETGWLRRSGYLVVSSSVRSSFQPESSAQSLHQVAALQKGTPCRLGLSVNLTDWLPARAADWVSVGLDYVVVQDAPFKELVDQMGKIGLVAKVALVQPELAVAVKVSEIVGRLLSYLLREASRHSIFSLAMDLNLANLKTGYHAVIGSHTDEHWPNELQMTNGLLKGSGGHSLPRHCYAVVEVLALPRCGEESARDQPWWELLQAGKEQALDAGSASDQERWEALDEWQSTLAQVRELAYRDRGRLLREIDQIIQSVQSEVEKALLPEMAEEGYGADELPKDWQELLGVRTGQEFERSVRDYQDALDVSYRLMEQYQLGEH